MKTIRQWLFGISAAISLLIFLATCIIWVRSQWLYDSSSEIELDSATGHYVIHAVITDSGRLVLIRDEGVAPNDIGRQGRGWVHSDPRRYYGKGPLGSFDNVRWFSFSSAPFGIGYRIEIVVRLWMVAAFFAVLSLLWIIGWNRRHKPKPGFCANCGYDLRASPDRCPECGKTPTHPI